MSIDRETARTLTVPQQIIVKCHEYSRQVTDVMDTIKRRASRQVLVVTDDGGYFVEHQQLCFQDPIGEIVATGKEEIAKYISREGVDVCYVVVTHPLKDDRYIDVETNEEKEFKVNI